MRMTVIRDLDSKKEMRTLRRMKMRKRVSSIELRTRGAWKSAVGRKGH